MVVRRDDKLVTVVTGSVVEGAVAKPMHLG